MAGLVQAVQVGKRFAVKQNSGTTDLRELLSLRFNDRLRRRTPSAEKEDGFWALRDVSFTVQPGEAVGIVGHNGSGKSTLLKLLTGILKPTLGTLSVQGRVGALIEVGAGFHPDLTGRENVYLNGQILGLSRREIDARYDEIVQFAGLSTFMDTPVKRYSSGMYMRLGFSIAVAVEPDVLLIDEVLAVGDELFQRKCLKRMREFIAGGGIVLFVSHSMGQVQSLCSRTIWLDGGHLLFDGDTRVAAEKYLAVVGEREEEALKRERPEEWHARQLERAQQQEEAEHQKRLLAEAQSKDANANRDFARAHIRSVRLFDAEGRETDTLPVAAPCHLELRYFMPDPLPNPLFTVEFLRVEDDLRVFATNTHHHGRDLRALPPDGIVTLYIDFQAINAGKYRVRTNIFPDYNGEEYWRTIVPVDTFENAAEFTVPENPLGQGCAYLPVRWEENGSAGILSLAQPPHSAVSCNP